MNQKKIDPQILADLLVQLAASRLEDGLDIDDAISFAKLGVKSYLSENGFTDFHIKRILDSIRVVDDACIMDESVEN